MLSDAKRQPDDLLEGRCDAGATTAKVERGWIVLTDQATRRLATVRFAPGASGCENAAAAL